jgi:hypothetical protein
MKSMANNAELRKALEEARHALVTIDGDRGYIPPQPVQLRCAPGACWKIDNKAAIEAIDRALRSGHGGSGPFVT